MKVETVKFEDLDLKLIPMERPEPPKVKLTLSMSHLKSGARNIRLGVKARAALHNPVHVQVLANRDTIAIRAADKGDQHARRVSKVGNVQAIELVRAFGLKPGDRIPLEAWMDAGHLVANVPERSRP